MRNLHIVIDHISFVISPLPWRCFALAFLFVGCKRGDSLQEEQLYGKWDIARAERNGKETSYLRRGYFIIEQNGMMTVNITGADEKGPYKMSHNKLVMGTNNFDFRIIQTDSMIVNYIAGPTVHFVFYMQKKHADIH